MTIQNCGPLVTCASDGSPNPGGHRSVRTTQPPSVGEWPGIIRVAECRPNHTIAAQDDIQSRGCPCYVPTIEAVRYKHGKRQWATRPLLPGYVFAFMPDEFYSLAVRQARLVYATIKVLNQERLRRELASLEMALGIDPRAVVRSSLMVGEKARITSGPFMGVLGIVQRSSEKNMLYLEVTMLGKTVEIELDPLVTCVEAA